MSSLSVFRVIDQNMQNFVLINNSITVDQHLDGEDMALILKYLILDWSFNTDRQGFLIKIWRKFCVLPSFSVCAITPFLSGTVIGLLIRLPVRTGCTK